MTKETKRIGRIPFFLPKTEVVAGRRIGEHPANRVPLNMHCLARQQDLFETDSEGGKPVVVPSAQSPLLRVDR
jgi:hypothetical protein